MQLRRTLLGLLGVIALGGGIALGWATQETWLSWLPTSGPTSPDEKQTDAHSPLNETQSVRLSPQAQANLRLVVKPLQVDTYWRTLQTPGLILDRPAQSDRGIVAPVTSVVTKVHHFPGDIVRPGEPLFTLRLLSETLHLTQSELFKTTKEIDIAKDQKKRLASLEGAVAGAKTIEIDYQLNRFAVAAQAYRTELLSRGLTPQQIEGVAEGKYVSEIEVATPTPRVVESKLLTRLLTPRPAVRSADAEPFFEMQDLKVELGQQVQAGQALCLLSNHQALYIEGRAFRPETPLLERAAKEGWPIHVEFMEDEESGWPPLEQTFTIRHIANTIDMTSRTFAFYIPLVNQSRRFEKDDRTLMLWRFRPGQKVRLHLRVEKLDNVFVLPADAVVREGPEAYVFRQNGKFFDRKPVRVLHQDRQHVVLANDGSVPPGLFVAYNGAAQINRVLKSSSGSLPPGFHMHADGSIHSNAAHK